MKQETASTDCQVEHLCRVVALSLCTAQRAALPAQSLGAHLVRENSWRSPESTLALLPSRSDKEQFLSMSAHCSYLYQLTLYLPQFLLYPREICFDR